MLRYYFGAIETLISDQLCRNPIISGSRTTLPPTLPTGGGASAAVAAGRALIDRCLQLCRARGAQKLVWETAPDNATAQRLYDGIGAEKSSWLTYELDA